MPIDESRTAESCGVATVRGAEGVLELRLVVVQPQPPGVVHAADIHDRLGLFQEPRGTGPQHNGVHERGGVEQQPAGQGLVAVEGAVVGGNHTGGEGEGGLGKGVEDGDGAKTLGDFFA